MKEAETYLKTKWPNAELRDVKGGTYLDLLRIQRNERMCAECPGPTNCQANCRILQLVEEQKMGRSIYRICYGPCLRSLKLAEEQVSAQASELAKNLVPEAMRSTVDYLLLKTGRTSLTEAEISSLKILDARHYPARVQKEIDKTVERFIRNKEPLSKIKFTYIAKALENQMSRAPRQVSEIGALMNFL